MHAHTHARTRTNALSFSVWHNLSFLPFLPLVPFLSSLCLCYSLALTAELRHLKFQFWKFCIRVKLMRVCNLTVLRKQFYALFLYKDGWFLNSSYHLFTKESFYFVPRLKITTSPVSNNQKHIKVWNCILYTKYWKWVIQWPERLCVGVIELERDRGKKENFHVSQVLKFWVITFFCL